MAHEDGVRNGDGPRVAQLGAKEHRPGKTHRAKQLGEQVVRRGRRVIRRHLRAVQVRTLPANNAIA